jgi:hypothetical protein
MEILVLWSGLSGVLLGLFHKWIVLIPTWGLTMILVLANSTNKESGLFGWFVQVVAVTASLEIGYLVGLIARNFPLAANRSKKLGLHGLDNTSSNASQTRESGSNAA